MYRILKPTGSIFLHCDWHANAYIRVDILDKIFGMDNFRGEIIWQRHNAHNDAKKKIAVLTDTIWYYTCSEKYIYNPIYGQLDEKYVNDFYRYEDKKGLYQLGDLTAPNIRHGDSASEWKGVNPTTNNRHWAIPVKAIEELVGSEQAKTLSTTEKLDLLYENNLIEIQCQQLKEIKHINATFCKINDQIHCGGKHEKKTIIREDT
jgi:DNA modification methylase